MTQETAPHGKRLQCTWRWRQTSQYTFLKQVFASTPPNFICGFLCQQEHFWKQNIWRNPLFRAVWDVNKKNNHSVVLFLLSPLVNVTKELQYAQVNLNCQADNLLCNHPSKVTLQLVDWRKAAHLKPVSALQRSAGWRTDFPSFLTNLSSLRP